MNDRIQELATQAFFETEYDDAQNLPETMERFAELIVQECVGIADQSNVTGKSIIGERIKEHFGVKE